MSDKPRRTDLANQTSSPRQGELTTSRNEPLAPLPAGSSVLEHALNRLPPEQQEALLQRALEEKIQIDVDAARAKQGHHNFHMESNQSVEHVRELARTGMDINASYEGRMASGNWRFEAKKSNYMVIMVVAAIMGIVLVVAVLAMNR